MGNLASFCFKFKTKVNGKLTKCKITIDLREVSPTAYQVITNLYEGIKIIDTLGSSISCYSYCLDVFHNSITRQNINRVLNLHYNSITK